VGSPWVLLGEKASEGFITGKEKEYEKDGLTIRFGG
jgi:hypothetical protein